MATLDLQGLGSVLKTQYLPVLNKQFNDSNVLISRLEKDYESVTGTNFTMGLHVGRNMSVCSRNEGESLPEAGSQKYANCIVPQKNMYGRIELTGQTIAYAKGGTSAYIKALESEMQGVTNDFKASLNRQIWGDGTGLLTKCGVTTASTTVNVETTLRLSVGTRIDIYNLADTSSIATGRTVLGIVNGTSFVISGANVTTTALMGIYVDNSKNKEMMGFGGIFSNTSTLQGLSPSTSPFWKANIIDNGGTNRVLTEVLLQQGMDATRRYSDGKVTAIYTGFEGKAAVQSLLTLKRGYQNTMELKGGYKAIDYNGTPIIEDKECLTNLKAKFYFTDEDELKFYRGSDIVWMDDDGDVLHRVHGKDAYEGTLKLYHELGCSKRNAMTLLDDITPGY